MPGPEEKEPPGPAERKRPPWVWSLRPSNAEEARLRAPLLRSFEDERTADSHWLAS